MLINIKRASDILSRYRLGKVLVVGDLMLDRYVTGNVTRISPEAPVPVIHVTKEYSRPGGAANVALNIASLGGKVSVAGVVGDDEHGRELMALLKDQGVGIEGVVIHPSGRTICKTRIVAERQQVARVDREDPPESIAIVLDELVSRIKSILPSVTGVILEDYGKGTLCQATVDAVRFESNGRGLIVGYDPKDNHELDVSGITFATPNWMEACVCSGTPHVPLKNGNLEVGKIAATASKLKTKWNTKFMVVTLGAHGMFLLDEDGTTELVPTKAREVFDVSGAGDTVIAACMLSLLAGASHREAVALSNSAAGVVVGKFGTATCSQSELLENSI